MLFWFTFGDNVYGMYDRFFLRLFIYCRTASTLYFKNGLVHAPTRTRANISVFSSFPHPRTFLGFSPQFSTFRKMSTDVCEELATLRVSATRLAEEVRILKKSGQDFTTTLNTLTKTREEIAELEKNSVQIKPKFYTEKNARENLIKRRFFVVPSYEIYGGVGGLYDFGPPGCALKSAVETLWRSHFVLEEHMLEISGPCLTPYAVLKVSGHVDRFTDLMIKDVETLECLRADKYLEEHIEALVSAIQLKPKKTDEDFQEISRLEKIARQADAYTCEEMRELIKAMGIKSPKGNELSEPFPFNLMFPTKVGPRDDTAEGRAFLRPETAQGIFVNFRRLYEYNGGKMPFACATLGLGFRNEIAPRNGLLRVREFQMGEIEHFCHPEKKNEFPKFKNVKDMCIPLYSREKQLSDGLVLKTLTLEDAVETRIVDNKTLAYFLARSFMFVIKCGIPEEHVRFRQHLKSEMAHYSADCWDLEIETSYGWIEVAGHADRAAYDLTSHTRASGVELVGMEKFPEPRVFKVLKLNANKQILGKTFRQNQAIILEALNEFSDDRKMDIEQTLETQGSYSLALCDGNTYVLTREMLSFKSVEERVSEKAFIPSVIEPSFGIGRILHCIMEHAYSNRGIDAQEDRAVMKFPALIAPTKVVVLPLSSCKEFMPIIDALQNACVRAYLSVKVDSSNASIGKRYARNDEVGTPFAITVDFETVKGVDLSAKHEDKCSDKCLKESTVTLRERDSMRQVRCTCFEAVNAVKDLCAGHAAWKEIENLYPSCEVKEE